MDINNIQFIAYDFDGVMTDNQVYLDQDGREMVKVNRADGLGISMIRKLGIDQIIITTEINPVVSVRAKKVGMPCIQGVKDKKHTVIEYCKKNKYSLENIAFVGNDLNDYDAMKIAGITFCPADAHDSIKEISDHVLSTRGGHGVVRELYDIIAKREGNI